MPVAVAKQKTCDCIYHSNVARVAFKINIKKALKALYYRHTITLEIEAGSKIQARLNCRLHTCRQLCNYISDFKFYGNCSIV